MLTIRQPGCLTVSLSINAVWDLVYLYKSAFQDLLQLGDGDLHGFVITMTHPCNRQHPIIVPKACTVGVNRIRPIVSPQSWQDLNEDCTRTGEGHVIRLTPMWSHNDSCMRYCCTRLEYPFRIAIDDLHLSIQAFESRECLEGFLYFVQVTETPGSARLTM